MGPFDYLSGLSTILPIYPLLDAEDSNSKYSIKVDFDKMKAYKVKMVGDVVKQSIDLGTMKGLNAEANFVAVDGQFCTAEKGPFHSRISVICGREFELRELEQKDPCWFVIKVAHPRQCKDEVKSIGGWKGRYDAQQRVDAVYAETA
jgi:Glucosidase II beta subunit-like protein